MFGRRSASSHGESSSGDSGGAPGRRTRTMQLQRRGGAAPAEPAALPSGGGAPLAAPVQARMEDAFGIDLDALRVHESPQVGAMRALAAAQGTELHFAPGQYQPETRASQELIGHEVTHVVQQAQGRVAAPVQAKGAAINADPALEREADELGARAAAGERVAMGAATIGGAGGPVQLQTGGGPTRADATSTGDDRDERSARGRPERPAESGTFGTPYTSWAEAAAAEAYLRATLLPSSLGMFGSEVASLWNQFLSREPGASLAPVVFREELSSVAFAFKHCQQIATAQDRLLDEIVGNISAAGTLPAGSWTTVPLSRFFAVPRELSINFSNPYDTPGHIAGGQSGSDAGPDTRSIQDGSVRILRQTDETGATTQALLEPSFNFRVFDAIDFIPGGAGAGIEQVFTIPLSRLEASGWAYDVPFEVLFTGPVTRRTVPGSALNATHPTNPGDATREERQRDPAAPEEREPSRSRLGERDDTRRRDL